MRNGEDAEVQSVPDGPKQIRGSRFRHNRRALPTGFNFAAKTQDARRQEQSAHHVTNVQFVLMPSDARAGMIVGLVYEQRVHVVEADEVHFVHGRVASTSTRAKYQGARYINQAVSSATAPAFVRTPQL